MTEIKPFKAVIFNQEKIKDLYKAVCPPYDIISQDAQEYYHNLSPYNFIHILLGRDTFAQDKYLRAENYFKDWSGNKVFIQDQNPAIYFYSQQYSLKGEKKTRLGFISLLHLGDKDQSAFAHEQTQLAPKEDRLKLLRQLKANLSPIFVIFRDNKRIIQRLWQHNIQEREPFIDIVDSEKVSHKLWRLQEPGIISGIQASMASEDIFIADGHHRFEVACAYRDEIKQKLAGNTNGKEDFYYIMTYFTNTDPRGLSILPIHRLLKLDFAIDLKKVIESLSEYFDIEEIKEKGRFFFLMEKGGRSEHVLGMYKDKRYWLLRLKNVRILEKMIPGKNKEYRSLDVSILNHIVFEKVLGCSLKREEGLSFSPDAEELIRQADGGPAYLIFFLNPTKTEQIVSLAINGERMPAKSTYFYPKLLSGLVINKHAES